MRTIWKFGPFDPGVAAAVWMPAGAVVRHFGAQEPGRPHLWAESERDAKVETRRFVVIGTGFDLPPDATYIASTLDRAWVWHLFELPT